MSSFGGSKSLPINDFRGIRNYLLTVAALRRDSPADGMAIVLSCDNSDPARGIHSPGNPVFTDLLSGLHRHEISGFPVRAMVTESGYTRLIRQHGFDFRFHLPSDCTRRRLKRFSRLCCRDKLVLSDDAFHQCPMVDGELAIAPLRHLRQRHNGWWPRFPEWFFRNITGCQQNGTQAGPHHGFPG